MIAILTDKPSVGKEIGRIIGATKVRNGYVEGNGYMVTWTFGNMLSLAMPKDYGTQKLERNDFPFIPSEFELMVRHTRTENGWIPEIDAVLQLKVIERVFQACDTIIAATDASRDGEMTFRYVYQYLNCTQPCFRLWISSLTDESVRKGMENLKPDSCYDSLFLLPTAATRRTGFSESTPAMPCARRLALATIPSGGYRHRYWPPSADATVKGRTIFHRTAGPSTSACKRTVSFSRCAAHRIFPTKNPQQCFSRTAS